MFVIRVNINKMVNKARYNKYVKFRNFGGGEFEG